jgi:hypothetical protein
MKLKISDILMVHVKIIGESGGNHKIALKNDKNGQIELRNNELLLVYSN